MIKEIERGWIRVDQLPLREPAKVDLGFLYSPLKLYEVNGVTYPKDRLEQLIAIRGNTNAYTVSPPTAKPMLPTAYQTSQITANQNLLHQLNSEVPTMMVSPLQNEATKNLDPNLVRIIKGLGSNDSIVARASMNELNDILENEEKQAILRNYEDIYVEAILKQFENLNRMPTAESYPVYQQLLYNLYSYLGTKTLCKRLSMESLKSIMAALLGLMAEQKWSQADPHGVTKVINGICVKILDHANFTTINW